MAALGRFLTGLLLGLAVVPLALAPVYTGTWDYAACLALGLALLVGALVLVRRDVARVAGVVSGTVVGAAAYLVLLWWLLANLFQ